MSQIPDWNVLTNQIDDAAHALTRVSLFGKQDQTAAMLYDLGTDVMGLVRARVKEIRALPAEQEVGKDGEP